MRRPIKAHIRPYQRPRPNSNLTYIQNDTIEVEEDVGAEVKVGAVVDADRFFDPWFVLEEGVV